MDCLFTKSLDWLTFIKMCLCKKLLNSQFLTLSILHTGPSVVHKDDILKVFRKDTTLQYCFLSLFTTCCYFGQWGFSTNKNTKEFMSENPNNGLSQLSVDTVQKVL